MITTIVIKGQIMGNNILRNKLVRNCIEAKELPFFNHQITYQTKKDAKDAIKLAFKELAADEPDMVDKVGGIEAGKDYIFYDASEAWIESN